MVACSGEKGPEADAHRKRGTELREQLVAVYPKSGEFRRDLANSYEDDANAIAATDPAAALVLQEKALSLRTAVVDDLNNGVPGVFDPQRPADSEGRMLRLSGIWMQRDLGINYSAIAELQARLGKLSDASVNACKARDVLWPLTQQNPTVVDFVDALDDSCVLVQKTATASGDNATAESELNKELQQLKNLAAARPDALDVAAKVREIEARTGALKTPATVTPPTMIP